MGAYNAKGVVVAAIVLAIIVWFAITMSSSEKTMKNTTTSQKAPVIPEVGVDGDTPEDTLHTLVTKQTNIQKQQRSLSEVFNEFQKTQIKGEADRQKFWEEVMARLEKIETDQKDKPTGSTNPRDDQNSGPEYTVFNDGGDTNGWRSSNSNQHSNPTSNNYVDILPLRALEAVPEPLQPERDDTSSLFTSMENTEPQGHGDNNAAIEQRYTIPMNSTLFDATAMTAMIGRVPVNGGVNEPFPFKVILGVENLAANGHRIPGLSGMIFAGVAKGDWNLSCVRATIRSATYIWGDGRVQTLTSKTLNNSRTGAFANEDTISGESIGWISTPTGIPCVKGKRISDAGTSSALRVALGLGEGYAEAKAQSQMSTTMTDSGAPVGSVTGDSGEFYKNLAVSGAMKEMGEIIKERWRETYDAIFVEPGHGVSVHISRTLHLDYNPSARMLVNTTHKSPTTRRLD